MVGGKNMSIINRTKGEKIFDTSNTILMFLICFTTLYPFYHLFITSISGLDSNNVVNLSLIPKGIDFEAYKRVFESPFIAYGFVNTIKRLFVGVTLSVIFMITTAYPLSKKLLPHRTFFIGIIVFTMFFNGGLIPMFLLIKKLEFTDKIWALVLPVLIPTYSMIIMRNFFASLGDELEESAKLDGANDITILIRIIVPLSKPIIATVTLWTAVWHWNAWFDSMIYMTAAKKQVLQMVLRRVVLEGSSQMMDTNSGYDELNIANPESIKAATIYVATLPILMFYPFLQKYFVKGIMVGSLKG
jgi:putative aldouronate transport system permease protein